MLLLPNYSEDCIEVLLMKEMAALPQASYLITVKFLAFGKELPSGLSDKVIELIDRKKPQSFKFIYQESGWRLLLTFISVNTPIEKSFSLVNDFVKLCKNEL